MKIINISIAGVGNVGENLIKNISENEKYIADKSNIKFNILGLSAKNIEKERNFNKNQYQWYQDPLDLINKSNPDIIVELMGLENGISYSLIKSALLKKIHVVTANKALLAKHGNELFKLAEENKVLLLFEAAVAGGIPIIKTIKNSLFLNKISKISGILNGTTNYILSEMYKTNTSFEKVLKIAQQKGFAESDPTNDIEGIDAAHKLTILSVLCFGNKFNFDKVIHKGINNIENEDIKFSNQLGYRIKLISSSEIKNNKIYSIVEPKLLKKDSKLANVNGVLNGIKIETNDLESLFFEGEGAGGLATSASIISDLFEIYNDTNNCSLGYKIEQLKDIETLNSDEILSSFYLRINVKDVSGVLATITSHLNKEGISIETFLQIPENYNSFKNNIVPLIMTTHETKINLLNKAINNIKNLEFVVSDVIVISIDKNL